MVIGEKVFRLTFASSVIAAPACESPVAPVEWSATQILGEAHLHNLAFGNGLWVVVGQQGKLATSPDLRVWTERPTHWVASDDIHNVHFAGGLFVAAGTDRSGSKRYISVSSDGVVWSSRTVPVDANSLGPLHYSERLIRWFVSGKRDGGSVLLSSSDLVTWTEHEHGFGPDPIISITEGMGKIMISGGSEKIGASVNGTVWDVRHLQHSEDNVNDIDKIRFFAGTFIAILHPDPSVIYRSSDGETWEPFRTGWPPREPSCIVWQCQQGPGGWVAIARGNGDTLLATGVHGKMMLSFDLGRTWITLASPVTTHLNSVHSDGRRFVVAGNAGTIVVVNVRP